MYIETWGTTWLILQLLYSVLEREITQTSRIHRGRTCTRWKEIGTEFWWLVRQSCLQLFGTSIGNYNSHQQIN